MLSVAFNVGLGEFLVKQFVVPTFVCLAIMIPIAFAAKLIRPLLAQSWAHSQLRSRFRAMSKASLCLLVAVVFNLLVIQMCLPLLRVPTGSGIKPMGLIFFSLVFNVVLAAMCRRIVQDDERPQGSRVLLGIAMLLCLTPFLGGVFLMHLIAIVRNLEFG